MFSSNISQFALMIRDKFARKRFTLMMFVVLTIIWTDVASGSDHFRLTGEKLKARKLQLKHSSDHNTKAPWWASGPVFVLLGLACVSLLLMAMISGFLDADKRFLTTHGTILVILGGACSGILFYLSRQKNAKVYDVQFNPYHNEESIVKRQGELNFGFGCSIFFMILIACLAQNVAYGDNGGGRVVATTFCSIAFAAVAFPFYVRPIMAMKNHPITLSSLWGGWENGMRESIRAHQREPAHVTEPNPRTRQDPDSSEGSWRTVNPFKSDSAESHWRGCNEVRRLLSRPSKTSHRSSDQDQ